MVSSKVKYMATGKEPVRTKKGTNGRLPDLILKYVGADGVRQNLAANSWDFWFMSRVSLNLFGLLFLVSCGLTPARKIRVEEASGVTRHGSELLVVDDSAAGAYFRIPLCGDLGPLIPLNRPGVERVDLPNGRLAIDLEGIDWLADGRLVVLSERLRCLVDENGVVAEYPPFMTEFARRGLEGVAVRPLPDGSSRVAVLWEGGYPDDASVPVPLRERLGHQAMRPVILVHDLKPGVSNVMIRMHDALALVELEVPKPAGEEPEAQRFRAPDLVWNYQVDRLAHEPGFLILISSQNSADRPQYLHHWLQRFDLRGKPVGEPLDLSKFLPPAIQGANWEGLSWFEKGKKLVLVYEGEPNLPPNAFILTLPIDWQNSRLAVPQRSNRHLVLGEPR